MSEWKDISTAPKDGTRVLLIKPGCGPVCGFWRALYAEWLISGTGVCYDEPNHWMPLPQPPEQS